MKQVSLTSFGSIESLQVVEQPVPSPGKGQLLVRVIAAGVNYSDLLRRRNTYFMPTPLPYVLGAEAVGEVVALGDGVGEPYQTGSRVLAILPAGGGYAEYVVAEAAYCVPLPPHVDAAAATAIFVQGSTAHLMLHQLASDLHGKTVLIHAAAGGVGSLLVQLAKLAGARVIATASTEAKLQVARELGADLTINYTSGNWPSLLLAANDGEKVDLVLEMVGGKIYEQSFECLTIDGTMIVYGAASGEKGFIHSEAFVDGSFQILGFNLAHFIQYKTELWQQSLGAVIGLLAEGKVQVVSSSSYPLREVRQAHLDIENRLTTGKVVLIA